MASPSALAAVLDEQNRQPVLFGVGQRPTFSSLYPTVGMNTPPLPPYDQRTAEQKAALIEEMFPDLAPTQLVKGVAGAAADRLMQANEAMPWGGNNPQAIGMYPDNVFPEGRDMHSFGGMNIDPDVLIPFATDVAGMATTGSIGAPPVTGAVGMGVRGKMRHNPFEANDDLVDELYQVAKDQYGGEVGIRIDDGVQHAVGDTAPPSRIWDDGTPTEDFLDGTSAVQIGKYGEEISRDDIRAAIEALGPYFGDSLHVVAGRPVGVPEDVGEVILQYAKVLASKSKTGGRF